jgi:hypothetical protein
MCAKGGQAQAKKSIVFNNGVAGDGVFPLRFFLFFFYKLF